MGWTLDVVLYTWVCAVLKVLRYYFYIGVKSKWAWQAAAEDVSEIEIIIMPFVYHLSATVFALFYFFIFLNCD